MKLSFYGADQVVTGSCHMLTACGKTVLIDCGLYQGKQESLNTQIAFDPKTVDFVLLSHAHIDHSGRLPLLVKKGCRAPIFTTRVTGELVSVMLRDTAAIQIADAEMQNRKNARAGKEQLEPLFTYEDVDETMTYIVPRDYDKKYELCPGISYRFTDAGHLLGSAVIEIWIEEDGVSKKLVFSGDLGNVEQPLIRDPQPVKGADYLIIESTYGTRLHDRPEHGYTEELAQVIESTIRKGGNVIIPAFAVGRTQEVLYFIREIKEQRLTHGLDFPVVVDSPLAAEATQVFSGDLHGYLDEEAIKVLQSKGNVLTFPGLKMSVSAEESKALNDDRTPKVIISASGMCDAGRIRHHLKHNLWRPECTVVLVGYQTEGSVGRRLLDGEKTVKLFGEEIAVKAKTVNFLAMSAHADRDGLLSWAEEVKPAQEVFVVHGDPDSAQGFTELLREHGYSAHAPLFGEEYDLAANALITAGHEIMEEKPDSVSYSALLRLGQKLLDIIRRDRKKSDGLLDSRSRELEKLVKRWDKQ